jgi:Na+/melibiose symporter-like transporter
MYLSRARLLAYGVTGFPLAALGLPLYVYVPTFYAESLGVGMASVGFALPGVRLFDMASDPVVGALSDHWQSRFGRRKGLMLLGLPVLMLGLEQLFRPAGEPGAAYPLGWGLTSHCPPQFRPMLWT